jgi:hypothetical protein
MKGEDEDESTVDERSMAEVVNVRKRRVSFHLQSYIACAV